MAIVHRPHAPVTNSRIRLRPKRSAAMAQIGPNNMRAKKPIAFSSPRAASPTPKATVIWGKNVRETPPSVLSMDCDTPNETVAPKRPLGGWKSASSSL